MKEFWMAIRIAFAALGAWIGYFVNKCDWLIYVFTALIIAEYLLSSIKNKEILKGLCKKVLILFLAGVVYLVDLFITGSMFQMAVMFFFIPNETALLLNALSVKTITESLFAKEKINEH